MKEIIPQLRGVTGQLVALPSIIDRTQKTEIMHTPISYSRTISELHTHLHQ